MINPTETEISDIEEDMGIDRDYIRAALDEEEPSRIEFFMDLYRVPST